MNRRAARRFREDGWLRVGGLVPPEVCEAVRRAFDAEVRPHDGPLLRQLTSRMEPHDRTLDGLVANPVVNPRLLTGFPTFCTSEERVMRACPLVAWVAALLRTDPLLLQSAYYDSSRGTLPHVDTNPLDADAPMLGAFIALEDIGPDAGRFFVWPGSDRWPAHDARVARFRALSRASWRQAFVERVPADVEPEVQALLAELSCAYGTVPAVPVLRRGDVLFWASGLVHGSHVPVPGGGSRASLLLHFVALELWNHRTTVGAPPSG